MKLFLLILKNLRRNLLRTALTCIAIFVLVIVVTLVWTVLWFLDRMTAEKSQDFKAIVTEKYQVPSQMPFAYARSLEEGAVSHPDDVRPTDSMTWQFYGGTIDPANRTRENMVFFFAMEPKKLIPMMDELENLDPALVDKLLLNKRGCILGTERLEAMNKRVGERITVTSINYKDINLEFDILGTFPPGRYDQSAVMNRDYLNDALDAYPKTHGGTKHPLADRSLNLVWLRVPDSDAFRRLADQIMISSQYTSPAVKCETASSGISSFLEAYRDLLNFMKWVLVPAILVTMTLVVTNAISISVRERRPEMAVLKVLGFGPGQILFLVLGEALLIGSLSGFTSASLTYLLISHVIGGIKFPIAFFPAFFVPINAMWWGLSLGAGTALAGSIVPAWSARTVKVSEVFSKVA